MAGEAVSSSAPPLNDDKPVIVRVKRKSYQSPLEAFWLEINERPVKRPLLDFEKLSINDSAPKVEELKSKKLFVQRVETVSSADVAVDVLQSFVASKPNFADGISSEAKVEDHRRSNKTDNKQKQLLLKAKEKQELLAKNARFKQIWKKRKGADTAESDDALHDMCRLYDIERVDVGETSQVHEHVDEEDRRLMHSFLPLLQEFIPSAAEEIKSDIDYNMTKQGLPEDDYVYDLYAVKDGNISMMEENTSSPFPSVQVDDDDDFYDGPDNSDYETDDSNAEDNPLNDYPDEEDEDDEDGSKSSEENSEENESESSRSETITNQDLSEDDILMNYDEEFDYDDDNDDDESYVWQG